MRPADTTSTLPLSYRNTDGMAPPFTPAPPGLSGRGYGLSFAGFGGAGDDEITPLSRRGVRLVVYVYTKRLHRQSGRERT